MVAISHDERWAYVANSGNGTVSFLDLMAKKESAQVPIGGVPMGLALSADGAALYVTNRTANGVAVIDTASAKVKRIIEIPGQPVRCHLTPDGRKLAVTLIDSGELAVVDVPTLTVERRLAAGQRVEGLMISEDGKHVYASAQADNAVVKYSTTTWQAILKIPTAARPDPMVLVP
jgi:YVTN family beta-propeller protein